MPHATLFRTQTFLIRNKDKDFRLRPSLTICPCIIHAHIQSLKLVSDNECISYIAQYPSLGLGTPRFTVNRGGNTPVPDTEHVQSIFQENL